MEKLLKLWGSFWSFGKAFEALEKIETCAEDCFKNCFDGCFEDCFDCCFEDSFKDCFEVVFKIFELVARVQSS